MEVVGFFALYFILLYRLHQSQFFNAFLDGF